MLVKITKRGRDFAEQLERFVGNKEGVLGTCSLIARHAATHARLQMLDCNGVLTDAQRRQETRLENRIRKLVLDLPLVDTPDGKRPIRVEFSGDPRGFTVKLVVPGDPTGGNTWGREGKYGI